MALKGTILKKEITDKILATFEGSFLYNDGKEIRIPGLEDGQELQGCNPYDGGERETGVRRTGTQDV